MWVGLDPETTATTQVSYDTATREVIDRIISNINGQNWSVTRVNEHHQSLDPLVKAHINLLQHGWTTSTAVFHQNDSPKEHQEQGDGTQILPIGECRNLEGCNHTNRQGHRNQIHGLWKQMG